MQKIMIIGCPGSGKSTLAKQLSQQLNLPLYHLDMIWHKPDKTNITREEFDQQLHIICTQEKWIIDGNYQRTLKMRLAQCDTVIFLDYPLDVCIEGARNRVGKERSDMPWIEQELDQEFKSWIENFSKTQRPEIITMIQEIRDKQIYIFTSRADTNNWIRTLSSTR